MARSVQDVLAELRASAEPQRQAVLNQVANLPTEQAAAESGLEAKKTQAYDDILSGARRRGLGFSGIPLGEQAKYNATDYAPAVANMKSSFNQRKGTLESALAGIDSGLQSQAYDIYNQDRTFEEQQRQFNENMALQRQQAAASAKAASGGFNLGGATAAPRATAQAAQTDPIQQDAYNEVRTRVTGDSNSILSDYRATLNSANRGNTRDKLKIQLYHQLRPDLFSNAVPATAVMANNVSY